MPRRNYGPPTRRSARLQGMPPPGLWDGYYFDGQHWINDEGHIWTENGNENGYENGNENEVWRNYRPVNGVWMNQNNQRSNRTESYGSENLNQVSEMPESLNMRQPENHQLERWESVRSTPEGEATDLIQSQDDVPRLERFYSVTQSRVRFVIYTMDPDLYRTYSANFGPSVQLLYNSEQNVPIDVVLLTQAVYDNLMPRMPASIANLNDAYYQAELRSSLTTINRFLLTAEADGRSVPTRPVFGFMCCSVEASRVGSDYVIAATGTDPFPHVQFAQGHPYIYIHAFTFLPDQTVGDEFFTGTHILEGLYLLFNPSEDNVMIYLEAVDVQATLDFYNRFGMERIGFYPGTQMYFNPFINTQVSDEVPYWLYNYNQIQAASLVSYQARRARQAGVERRIMDLVGDYANRALLQAVDPDDVEVLERQVSEYGHTRARRDPRPHRWS